MMDMMLGRDVDVARKKWLMEREQQLARGVGLFVAERDRQEWLC